MPLRETATIVPKKKTGFSCGVEKLNSKLADDDREWLSEQLRNDEVTAQWIADVLHAEGHEVSQGIISRHRAGRCRCGT